MAYKIRISARCQQQRDAIIEYLINNYKSPQAAKNFFNDYLNVIKKLKTNAESYAFCEDASLRRRRLRKIHFPPQNYKVVYLVNGDTVYIEAIFHDLQDYRGLV